VRSAPADAGLEAHGRLGEGELRDVLAEGLERVVRPCFAALLAARAPGRAGAAARA
jgi:plasmid stability protein